MNSREDKRFEVSVTTNGVIRRLVVRASDRAAAFVKAHALADRIFAQADARGVFHRMVK